MYVSHNQDPILYTRGVHGGAHEVYTRCISGVHEVYMEAYMRCTGRCVSGVHEVYMRCT
jgi:hypothetical protein